MTTIEDIKEKEAESLRKYAYELLDIINKAKLMTRSGDIESNKIKHVVDKMLQRANVVGPKSQSKQDKENYEKGFKL